MRLVCVSVLAALLAVVPASAGLIVNGGFETGDFSGWNHTGNTGTTGVVMSYPHSGAYSAYFGPVGSLGYLDQSVATTPGATYDLVFWLRNGSGTPSYFEVSWDGTVIFSTSNPGAFGYVQFIASGLVASGASTQVNFGFRQDPSYFHLDDVDVNPAGPGAVPEPSTWLLAAAGLGLLAFSRRRGRIG